MTTSKSAFENLTREDLQTIIGEKHLDSIRELIPYIDKELIRHPNDIYEKDVLIKILVSFFGQDAFYKKEFRKKILSRLSEKDIRVLATLLGISHSNTSFLDLAESISNFSWGDNESTKTIVRFLKLPDNYIPIPPSEEPNKETVLRSEVPLRTLKDYQFDICQKANDKLKHPFQRFLIQMPTGSGKTRTAIEVICDYLNKHPNKSVIWLVHSEELCEQAVECFNDIWSHLGFFEMDVIRLWGKHPPILPQKASFIVAGFPKLHSVSQKDPTFLNELSKIAGMVIVDEAHTSIAPTHNQIIKSLIRTGAPLIGLTATPGRSSSIDDSESQELADLYFGDKLSIDSGEETVFTYLKQKGILAHVLREPIQMDKIYRLSNDELTYLKKNLNFSPKFLELLSLDAARNIEIINTLRKEHSDGHKILFFGCDVAHSKRICAALNYLGIAAEHLDSTTRRDRRKHILNEFRGHKLRIICNFGILTTGFDDPKTDVIMVARPTLSVVLYSQMIGRGLRGPAMGGTEHCKIIDIIDNIENYEGVDLLYNYFDNYWK